MKKFLLLAGLILPFSLHAKSYENLSLSQAIEIVKSGNIEISIAKLDEKIRDYELGYATSQHFGRLDLVQNIMRSNDAGNVFGYALASREATFRNFGFSSFLSNQQNPNLLDIEPEDLNYPEARNFFQTKVQFTLPIFTGGKIVNYRKIQKSLLKIASLDKEKITSEKIRQTKKSFSDIILLNAFIKNLNIITSNIDRLELMTKKMQNEGYAKKVDILEVKSKKANVLRMLNQSKANKTLALQFLSFLLNQDVNSIDPNADIIPKYEESKKEDVEKTIDFKKANEALNLSTAQLNMSESNFLPTAGFIAEYGSSDDKFLDDFKEHDSYTFGVQIKWNIFSGGADIYAYQKAKVANLKAKEQIKLAKKGLWLKISKLNTEIKKLDFDISSVEAELELARDIYKNYVGRYKESLVSINDVLIKQSSELELVLKLKELQNKKYDEIFALNALIKGE